MPTPIRNKLISVQPMQKPVSVPYYIKPVYSDLQLGMMGVIIGKLMECSDSIKEAMVKSTYTFSSYHDGGKLKLTYLAPLEEKDWKPYFRNIRDNVYTMTDELRIQFIKQLCIKEEHIK